MRAILCVPILLLVLISAGARAAGHEAFLGHWEGAEMADGAVMRTPAELRETLMRHPEQFVQTMTANLLMFALGREVEYYDMPAVRQIVRDAAEDDYRLSALVLGVVKSEPFLMRRVPGDEGEVDEAALQEETATAVQ